jgi:formylglycine-generating enzyme required for sulfatase activity
LSECMAKETKTGDALPLLAFTLREMWDRYGSDGDLTLEEYEQVGRLEGSIARKADEELDAATLSEQQGIALRRAFLALARLNEEGLYARRTVNWSDLPPAARPVLERFVEARLLVSGKETGTVEVAHEALLRTWPTLVDWLDQERQKLEQRQRVRRLCKDLGSDALSVRRAALRSLETMAEDDPQAIQLADQPLADLLRRERLREETDHGRAGTILQIQTTAARLRLRLLHLTAGPAEIADQRLWVPSATIRADNHAVSTALVTLRLWPSPGEAGDLPPLRSTDGKERGAWFEPLTPVVALTMVEIPAGSFLMGSPEEEPERGAEEGPRHRVELDGFFMSQTPITQAQWRVVAGWRQVGREVDDPDPSNFKGADRPVENVSWFDAVEFCERLSQRTGRRYGLPSEAQWEYACRAGTSTPFHFGGTLTAELANYSASATYGGGPKGTNRGQTTDVGSFPANTWGLQDMHGNVREWCADQWHDRYEQRGQQAPADGRPWMDEQADEDRPQLLRGGSWNGLPRFCRSAIRNRYHPDYRFDLIGFRVCCLPQD